ncbi:MAG: hypothetical protein VKJ06_01395 [Vampirovibrionales bacterium]|nr:hypothetical protein [Vampirovibrionales bacterium]
MRITTTTFSGIHPIGAKKKLYKKLKSLSESKQTDPPLKQNDFTSIQTNFASIQTEPASEQTDLAMRVVTRGFVKAKKKYNHVLLVPQDVFNQTTFANTPEIFGLVLSRKHVNKYLALADTKERVTFLESLTDKKSTSNRKKWLKVSPDKL